MFICSFKLNKTRLVSGIAALCLSLTLIFLLVPEPTENTTSAGEVVAKDQQEMVDYLESVGFTVTPQAVLVEEVVIPETFNKEYEEYNELQKPAGFDLSKFMGKTAKKYTFKVLNYEDQEVEVVANLLVCEDRVIGGDISSTALGGFCHGLITEKTSESEEKTETTSTDTTETAAETVTTNNESNE